MWGKLIKVNGIRPRCLDDLDSVLAITPSKSDFYIAKSVPWPIIREIRLEEDHEFYRKKNRN